MFDILLTAVKKVPGRSKNHFGDVIGKIMDATVRYMKNSQCKNTCIILLNSVHDILSNDTKVDDPVTLTVMFILKIAF